MNKKKIAISAESTIDLSKELLAEYDIHIVPFTVTLGSVSKLDGEITAQEIFDYVDETGSLPKTSAVNAFQYEEHFNKLKEEYEEIIHFTLSSEMSSAYNNARLAAMEVEGVHIVDSRVLSTGIALEAIYAKKLADLGLEAEEIVSKVQERIQYNQTSFVLSRLDYLYKGGRCNALAMIGAKVLRLRPQIIVSDGKMNPGKKFIGNYSDSVIKYVDETLKEFNNPDLDLVFITYTHANESTIEAVRNKLIERGFKKILETKAGATITSHCGDHCLGILYMNDGNIINK